MKENSITLPILSGIAIIAFAATWSVLVTLVFGWMGDRSDLVRHIITILLATVWSMPVSICAGFLLYHSLDRWKWKGFGFVQLAIATIGIVTAILIVYAFLRLAIATLSGFLGGIIVSIGLFSWLNVIFTVPPVLLVFYMINYYVYRTRRD